MNHFVLLLLLLSIAKFIFIEYKNQEILDTVYRIFYLIILIDWFEFDRIRDVNVLNAFAFFTIGLLIGHFGFLFSLFLTTFSLSLTFCLMVPGRRFLSFLAAHPMSVAKYLLIAFVEEVVWRSYGQDSLGNGWFAVVVIAVSFTITHTPRLKLNPIKLIEFLIFSMMLGILYHQFGSILLVMGIHATRNIGVIYYRQQVRDSNRFFTRNQEGLDNRIRKEHQVKSILFFTWGRGWGHAIRDMVIIASLQRGEKSIRIGIISSEGGYQAYQAYGYECKEIKVPSGEEEWKWYLEVNEYLDEWGVPNLIVSDEHFGALTVAEELKVPSVFITDWLPFGQYNRPEFVATFDQAEAIIYPGYQSSTPVPEQLSGKVHFVGPIVRGNPFLQITRSQLKSEVGLKPDIPLILLMGGGTPENQRYFSTCIHAVERIKEEVQLVVIAGKLKENLNQEISSRVTVLSHTTEIQKYMAASEVVITRAGHTTLWELAVYAIPSITIPIPTESNPMQEIHAKAMEQWGYTHIILENQLSPETVMQSLQHLLVSQESERRKLKSLQKTAPKPGEEIAKEIILSMLN